MCVDTNAGIYVVMERQDVDMLKDTMDILQFHLIGAVAAAGAAVVCARLADMSAAGGVDCALRTAW